MPSDFAVLVLEVRLAGVAVAADAAFFEEVFGFAGLLAAPPDAISSIERPVFTERGASSRMSGSFSVLA
jgi:hypothetical protein